MKKALLQREEVDMRHVEELERRHKGQWIILLNDGSYVVGDTEDSALTKVPKGKKPTGFFRSIRDDELFLLQH